MKTDDFTIDFLFACVTIRETLVEYYLCITASGPISSLMRCD